MSEHRKRGAPSYPRYDSEIEKLIKIINSYGISHAKIIDQYRKHKNECPNTIRNKLTLRSGCTAEQFDTLKTAVYELKSQIDEQISNVR
jgi:hypothetical protein